MKKIFTSLFMLMLTSVFAFAADEKPVAKTIEDGKQYSVQNVKSPDVYLAINPTKSLMVLVYGVDAQNFTFHKAEGGWKLSTNIGGTEWYIGDGRGDQIRATTNADYAKVYAFERAEDDSNDEGWFTIQKVGAGRWSYLLCYNKQSGYDLDGLERGFKEQRWILHPTVSSGISKVEAQEEGEQKIYDLQGRRVYNPGKGLYIVNGKKVVL